MTEALDNVAHADLRVHIARGARFGDAVNQVAIFPGELARIAREYPVLFRDEGEGALQPLAILGLDRDENLFLDGPRWSARTVPAMLRRGPFLIASGSEGEPVVSVDLDDPRVASAGEGEAVFLPHGGHGPILEDAIEALRIVHRGVGEAAAMTGLFAELGLIESVALRVEVDDGHRFNFEGYGAVTPARIAALDGRALERLNREGWLFAAIQAADSLANMNELVRRKRRLLPASG